MNAHLIEFLAGAFAIFGTAAILYGALGEHARAATPRQFVERGD